LAPYRIQTPQPNAKKIVTVDYVYLFFSDQPTGQTFGRIFTRDDSKDAKSRKDVPFWVTKIEDDI